MSIRVGYDAKLKDVRWPFDVPKGSPSYELATCPEHGKPNHVLCQSCLEADALNRMTRPSVFDVDHETPE